MGCNIKNNIINNLIDNGYNIDDNGVIIVNSESEAIVLANQINNTVQSTYNQIHKSYNPNTDTIVTVSGNTIIFNDAAIATLETILNQLGDPVAVIEDSYESEEHKEMAVRELAHNTPINIDGKHYKNQFEYVKDYNQELIKSVYDQIVQISDILDREQLTIDEQEKYQLAKNKLEEQLRQLYRIDYNLKHNELQLNDILDLLKPYVSRMQEIVSLISQLPESRIPNALKEVQEIKILLDEITDTENNPIIDLEKLSLDDKDAYKSVVQTLLDFKRDYSDVVRDYLNILRETKNKLISNDKIINNEDAERLLTYDDIMAIDSGLPDIDWYTKWFTNASMGGLTEDLPMQLLEHVFEKNLASEQFKNASRIRELDQIDLDGFNEKLESIGGQGILIRRDEFGLKTNSLVKRFTKKYDLFRKSIEDRYKEGVNKLSNKSIYDKFLLKQLDKQLLDKHETLDVKKLFSEEDLREYFISIASDGVDIQQVTFVSNEERNEYRKELKIKYGENFTNELIEEQRKKVIEYVRTLRLKVLEHNKNLISLQNYKESLLIKRKEYSQGTDEYNSITTQIAEIESKIEYEQESLDEFIRYENPFIDINNDSLNTFKYITLIPNKNEDFYDENFSKLDNDEVLYRGYQAIKSVFKESQSKFQLTDDFDEIQIVYSEQNLLAMWEAIWKNRDIGISKKIFQSFAVLIKNFGEYVASRNRANSIQGLRDPLTNLVSLKPENTFYKTYKTIVSKDTIKLLQDIIYKIGAESNNVDLQTLFHSENNISVTHIDIIKNAIKKYVPSNTDLDALINIYRKNDSIQLKLLLENILINKELDGKGLNILESAKGTLSGLIAYNARLNSLPIGAMILADIHEIKELKTGKYGNINTEIDRDTKEERLSVVSSPRKNAIERADRYFIRNILGYSREQSILPSFRTIDEIQAEIDEENKKLGDKQVEEFEEFVSKGKFDKHHWYKFKSNSDLKAVRKRIVYLQNQLRQYRDKREAQILKYAEENTSDLLFDKDEEIKKLNVFYNSTTRKLKKEYIEAPINTGISIQWGRMILGYMRTQALGWNLNAAITNYLEGQVANERIAQSGEFFKTESFYKANNFWNSITINSVAATIDSSPEQKKLLNINRKFNVILDNTEALSKTESYDRMKRAKSFVKPYFLSARVEYANQMPLALAMMYDTKIYDKNNNESNLFDALDNDGNLKEEFRTEENIKKYDNEYSSEIIKIRNKMAIAIIKTHGDYREHASIMALDKSFGRILLFLKRWALALIDKDIQVPQYNIMSGKKTKGAIYSLTKVDQFIFSGIAVLVTGQISAAITLPLLITTIIAPMIQRRTGQNVKAKSPFIGNIWNNLQETFTGIAMSTLISNPIFKIIANSQGKSIDIKKYIKYRATELDKSNTAYKFTQMGQYINYALIGTLLKGLFYALGNGFSGFDDDDDDEDKVKQATKALVTYTLNKVNTVGENQTQMAALPLFYELTVGNIPIQQEIETISKLASDVTDKGFFAKRSKPYENVTNAEFLGYKLMDAYPVRMAFHAWHGVLPPDSRRLFRSPYTGFDDVLWSQADQKLKEKISNIKEDAIRSYFKKHENITDSQREMLKKKIDNLFKKKPEETFSEQLDRVSQYKYEDLDKAVKKTNESKSKKDKKKSKFKRIG